MNFCWSLFQWGVFLGVAAALAAGGYLYFRLDDEICRQVEHRLADHYQNLSVHVGRARFEQDRGIAIYDLSLQEPQRDNTPQPLVSIEEMYLAGKVRMEELLSGQPRIERIVVRRARLRATRQPDGQWNVKTLLPLPHFSEQSPILTIEDATVILEDSARSASAPLVVRDIDLTLTPLEADAAAVVAAGRYRLQGTVTGLPARELHLDGEVSSNDGTLNLAATATGLEVSPELLAALPGIQTGELPGAELSGRADIVFQVSRPDAKAGMKWSATVKVDRGRLAHPLLPAPLTDLTFTAQADADRLFIERLAAKCGPSNVTLACERAGWSASAPLGLAARVVGLPLDHHLESVLPESIARVWRRFQPAGLVDAEVRLSFDGRVWRPQLSAECRGVSLTDAEKFPYLLEQTTGTVSYAPAGANGADRLQLNLMGIGGGRPVRIKADLAHLAPPEPQGVTVDTGLADGQPAESPGPRAAGYRGVPPAGMAGPPLRHPLGWVEISGSDIPLHEQLIAALPEKGESLVRSLRPQGAIDFLFRAEWKELSQPRADVTQEIRLKDCAIQYAPFPYPLHHVHGLVTERNKHWTLHDVSGRGGSDSATVVCRGESTPRGDACRVELTFQAENVPLDDNLKQALSPPVRLAWGELRPQGRVDFTAHAIHETGQPKPSIEVVLQPRERSVSIEPLKFPYRLEQVEGVATYQSGRVELLNVRARHDRAVYSAATGTWRPTPDGGWRLVFSGANADHLTAHRELFAALPPGLQKAMEQLQPSGTFGVYNSSLSFARSPQSSRILAAWDVNLDCHQASIQGGLPLRSVAGGIHLFGQNDGQTAYTAGELAIDSLIWKDTQFTNIRGPLWVDPSVCLLGEPATRKQGQPARRLTADAYGGSLAANAALEHAGNPSYRLDVALGAANLARFVNERLGGPKELSGTVSGKLLLSNAGRSTQTLSGAGELHIVDANIYELPVLVSLLKVLRNRTPTTTAFNGCDMQFTVQGEHIHFQKLNLLGDAVSLYGNGETNFDRELDLVFYTLIGPADLPIPLWKTIAGQVSRQGLELKVLGKWDDPVVQRKALPAVNNMLEQIQTEIGAGAATMAPTTAVRAAIAPR